MAITKITNNQQLTKQIKHKRQLKMGMNGHAVTQRFKVVSMACLASAAIILCALSGFSCSYVSIVAEPDRDLMTPDGEELTGTDEEGIGVLCDDSPFYVEWDRMWSLSQLFFWISLGLGSLTTLVAWTLSLFVVPTPCRWRMLSLLGAATAVMEVPIFLLFESEPCNMDISRQTCTLSVGAYFNIASVILWVFMTLWTQLLNPPNWSADFVPDDEAWNHRSEGGKTPIQEIRIPSSSASATGTEECSPQNSPTSPSKKNSDGGLYLNSKNELDLVTESAPPPGNSGGKILNNNDDMSDMSSITETDLESQVQRMIQNSSSKTPQVASIPEETNNNNSNDKDAAAVVVAPTTTNNHSSPSISSSSQRKNPMLSIEEKLKSMAELDKIVQRNSETFSQSASQVSKPPEQQGEDGGVVKSPSSNNRGRGSPGVTFGSSGDFGGSLIDNEPSENGESSAARAVGLSLSGGCDFGTIESFILENTGCFRNNTIEDNQVYDEAPPPLPTPTTTSPKVQPQQPSQQQKQASTTRQQVQHKIEEDGDDDGLPQVPDTLEDLIQEDVSMLHTVDTRDQMR